MIVANNNWLTKNMFLIFRSTSHVFLYAMLLSSWNIRVFFIIGIAFLSDIGGYASEIESPGQIIGACEKQIQKITTLQLDSKEIAKGNGYTQHTISKIKWERNLDCAYILTEINDENNVPSSRLEHCFKIDLGLSLDYQYRRNEITIRSMEGGIHVSKQKVGWKSVFYLSFVLAPLGIVRHDGVVISVFDMLRNMPPETKKLEMKDGNICLVEARNEEYIIRLEILSSKRYALKSYSIESLKRSGDDGFMTTHFLASEFIENAECLFPQNFSVTIDSKKTKYVVLSDAGESIDKFMDTTSKVDIKIDNLQINEHLAANDFKFETPVPDGTKVYVAEKPQIAHIWLKGEIVPKTSEVMLRIARGDHKFMPGVREPRFWMMALGILFIVFGISLKARSMVRQWREK